MNNTKYNHQLLKVLLILKKIKPETLKNVKIAISSEPRTIGS